VPVGLAGYQTFLDTFIDDRDFVDEVERGLRGN
jgi:hypothetical protein